jgi:hypothetical protein
MSKGWPASHYPRADWQQCLARELQVAGLGVELDLPMDDPQLGGLVCLVIP